MYPNCFRCYQKYNSSEWVSYKTSIIITYHPVETVDNLIRTISSILNRTSLETLAEIVLVNDGGTNGKKKTSISKLNTGHVTKLM